MMKRVVAFLVVIAALAVVGDLVLRHFAENAAADLIDKQIAQEVDPEVDLGGFPFFRSVLTGTFDRVTISVPEAAEGKLVVEDISLTLDDVKLEPLEVLAGRGNLRAASLEGQGVISQAALNAVLGAQVPGLSATLEPNRVSVTRDGVTVAATAVVAGNRILFRPGELGEAFEIPLPALLPEVQFSSLRATSGELVLEVLGSRVRLRT